MKYGQCALLSITAAQLYRIACIRSVSYTHLDVYKRQCLHCPLGSTAAIEQQQVARILIQIPLAGQEHRNGVFGALVPVSYTHLMPALMIRRLHIVQEFASDMIFPVDISRPTRYSVAPIIWSRGAAIMAFISACTERQNSYLSPRGMPIF